MTVDRRGTWRRWAVVVLVMALIGAACSSSGDDDGDGDQASAASGEPSGTLRVFAFEDSVIPEVLEPFEAEYPDVDVQTAAFGSGDEALTKLEAGFQTDVVEVCIREVPRS